MEWCTPELSSWCISKKMVYNPPAATSLPAASTARLGWTAAEDEGSAGDGETLEVEGPVEGGEALAQEVRRRRRVRRQAEGTQ